MKNTTLIATKAKAQSNHKHRRHIKVIGKGVYNRKEFENMLIEYCYDNNRTSDNTRNLLSAHTIEQNIKHHPFRLARELGFEVIR